MTTISLQHNLSPEEVYDQVTITEGHVMLLHDENDEDNGKYSLAILKHNDEIISFAILYHSKKGIPYYYDPSILLHGFEWELNWLQTDPKHQGKGYGSQLISYLEEHITEPIILLSLPKAVKFYLQNGGYLLSDFKCVFEKSNAFMVISNLESLDQYLILYDRWMSLLGKMDDYPEGKYEVSKYMYQDIPKPKFIEQFIDLMFESGDIDRTDLSKPEILDLFWS
jgi:GNAT superfamily N-acetyltransferase